MAEAMCTTLVFEKGGSSESLRRLHLELEELGRVLRISAGPEEWKFQAVTARRHYIPGETGIEPVTEVRGIRFDMQAKRNVSITVNCGATPPVLVLRENALMVPAQTLVITHEQQNAILDVLDSHLRRVGLPDLPARPPEHAETRYAA